MTAYLSLSEAAEATNKSRVTLRRYLDQGRFPNARQDESDPNRQWLIPISDLEAAGARLLPRREPDDLGNSGSRDVRLAVAEAVAHERAEALRQIVELASGRAPWSGGSRSVILGFAS